jgi:hypothetical protein
MSTNLQITITSLIGTMIVLAAAMLIGIGLGKFLAWNRRRTTRPDQ